MSFDVGKTNRRVQPFRHFTYLTAHSPTLPLLHLRHSSFSNPSVTSPTSQLFCSASVALPTSHLILQSFRCFTYVTAHFQTLPSLHLRHSSFSNASVALPTTQLILQSFRRFGPICHSSFSNLSVTSPTSQLIIQRFHSFTYVTAHSLTLPLLHLRHSSFSNPSFASPM